MFQEQLRMSDKEIRSLKNEVGAYNVQNKFKREPNKDALGKDEFLRLLTVQMSHQDPLSPMDNKDMIAQLAQFSSVEQITQVNKTLESMTSFYSEQNGYSMLGRSVEFMDEAGNRFLGPVEMVMQNNEGVALAVKTSNGVMTVRPEDIMMVHSDGALMASQSAEMLTELESNNATEVFNSTIAIDNKSAEELSKKAAENVVAPINNEESGNIARDLNIIKEYQKTDSIMSDF